MGIADSFGFLPGFATVVDWITSSNLLVAVLICWLFTPIGFYLIGLIGESRLVPVRSSKQFLSFMPGDFFLGASVGSLLWLMEGLPRGAFYASAWFHWVVLVAAFAVAVYLTFWVELREGVYGKRAILSPTKLYHNFVLYAGYGYVAVIAVVANVAGAFVAGGLLRGGATLLALLPGLAWLWMVQLDNKNGTEGTKAKARFAHVEDWRPIWVTVYRRLQRA